MRIIAKKTLREFWELHPDAKEPLLAWYREV
jgi:mRNA interferase HigB